MCSTPDTISKVTPTKRDKEKNEQGIFIFVVQKKTNI